MNAPNRLPEPPRHPAETPQREPQPAAATERTTAHPDAESPYKSTGGAKRIWNALGYSLRGLISAWRFESAFRQELSLAIVLIPIALLLPLSPVRQLALIASVVMVLIVELINSSIEAAVDRISLDHHRLSGRAKDLGSAAVLLALFLCMLTWILIAGPAIVQWISDWQ